LITGYILEADLKQCGEFSQIYNGAGHPEVTTFTITTVATSKYYSFRHKAINYNGLSTSYSDVFTTYACVLPTAVAKPSWVTSTTNSIKILWNDPSDNGGCPVREYRVLRDAGRTSGTAAISDITTEVHTAYLTGKSYPNGLEVTEFPAASVGKRFTFVVKVYTDFATAGVSSLMTNSIVLASLPSKPTAAPTRNTLTSETVVAAALTAVTGINGSAITSYHVQIDDGLGGAFTEL